MEGRWSHPEEHSLEAQFSQDPISVIPETEIGRLFERFTNKPNPDSVELHRPKYCHTSVSAIGSRCVLVSRAYQL
jgi:hypothetical protein